MAKKDSCVDDSSGIYLIRQEIWESYKLRNDELSLWGVDWRAPAAPVC